MDFDGDGHVDLVAGGFGGQSYYAPGSEEGFGPPVTIKDENGDDVRLGKHYDHEANEYAATQPPPFPDSVSSHALEARSESMALVDWDNDEDLDILLGSGRGFFYLRENIGTRTDPVYAGMTQELLDPSGQPLGTGMDHAAPVVVDWDGDGLFDIVSSGGEGGVVWFRNVGDAESPRFEVRQTLVPDATRDQDPDSRPGHSTAVEVVDLDGDSKLDLLVGDRSGQVWLYRQQ